MFNTESKHILITAALGMLSFSAIAQPSINTEYNTDPKAGKASSPFSRFGLGDMMSNNTIAARSIGGAATAYNNPFVVNTFNPATYAFMKTTMFDVGLEARMNKFDLSNKLYSSGTTTVSELSLAFPLGKSGGLALGFKPFTSAYYQAQDTVAHPTMGTVFNNYNINGSLNQVFAGVGYKIKGFSLGVNAQYTFGQLKYSTALEPNNLLNYANIENAQYNRIRGFDFNFGALYQKVFKEVYYINIGATYKVGSSLNVSRDEYLMSYRYNKNSTGGTIIDPIDTIKQTVDVKGTISLPTSFSFGVHYGKSAQWNVGVDYIHSNWKDFAFMNDRMNIAEQSQRLAVGAEVTPDVKAEKNRFFKNANFRAGLYYGKDFLMMNNEQMDFMGATIGASFPVRSGGGLNSFGKLNIGFDFGTKGNLSTHGIQNNYTKFAVGFTFNDIWFIKRKFD